MQAAPPRLPFVRGLGGYVVVTVDASRLERVNVGLGITAQAAASAAGPASASAVAPVNFAAAVAHEHELDLLLEGVHVGDFGRGNAPAAEHADMGKRVEVGHGD